MPGDLDQHGRIADIRIGGLDAEPDVAPAAPPPGPHEDERAAGQPGVQAAHGIADGDHVGQGRDPGVFLRVDVNDCPDAARSDRWRRISGPKRASVPSGIHGREDDRLLVIEAALRPALEDVEVFAVMGEFDVHRHAEGLAQDAHDLPHLFDEAGAIDEPGEGHDHLVPGRVIQGPVGLADRAPVIDREECGPRAGTSVPTSRMISSIGWVSKRRVSILMTSICFWE